MLGRVSENDQSFHHGPAKTKKHLKQLVNWHVYDNRGSFKGWFDWVPLWMRVGRWNPVAVLTIIIVYTSFIWFKPELQFAETALLQLNDEEAIYFGMPRETAIDLAIFAWGLMVLIHGQATLGNIFVSLGADSFTGWSLPFITFTGWSWLLLTSRAGLEFMAWVAAKHYQNYYLASNLAVLGSSIRFVTVTNSCVVCSIWNFILLPMIYIKVFPSGNARKAFTKFNFGFFMTNVHILNFPLACMNILNGSRTRLFTESDLWISYLVVVLYSLVYFFVLDRVGMHFYPIVNPRTALSIVTMVCILGTYYVFLGQWNAYLSV